MRQERNDFFFFNGRIKKKEGGVEVRQTQKSRTLKRTEEEEDTGRWQRGLRMEGRLHTACISLLQTAQGSTPPFEDLHALGKFWENLTYFYLEIPWFYVAHKILCSHGSLNV